jgi:uncharacterized protein
VTASTELGICDARRIAVNAQRYLGLSSGAGGLTVDAVLQRLGCVQYDAMTAVRRSHELVLRARGLADGPVTALGQVGAGPAVFEYQAHALCIIPLQLWPVFALRRRRYASHGWRGPEVSPAACDEVRRRLKAAGSLTLRSLGGAQGKGWERSSPHRWACEWLQAIGELVVLGREGGQRIYSWAADVLPGELAQQDLDDDECRRQLMRIALGSLGVATTKDVADYFRLPPREVHQALTDLGVQRVRVEGWTETTWMDPEADMTTEPPAGPVPLSPFDPLIWHRPRQERLFDRQWVLEAYKPADKRAFGYFAMPILSAGHLIGRIAARRGPNRTLVIEATEWDTGTEPGLIRQAVDRLLDWTRADEDVWLDHTSEHSTRLMSSGA